MKMNKKELMILIVPILIALILYPILPDMIPRQIRLDGSVAYMHKGFIFLLALLPFVVYKYRRPRR
ncbi:MAG TPA: DUF1648 domain-containing protein [Tissierellia bacterium]|nr:DUF1648 domain-containing protein [Tissierellia bacterium]